MPVDPNAMAKNWVSGMSSATQKYTSGVQGVQVAPGQKAAQSAQKWLNGIQAAYQNNSYQNGCQSVSLQSWQNSAVQKGAPRLSTGASAAQQKFSDVSVKLAQNINSAVAQVDAMPTDTLEQRLQRAYQFGLLMSKTKGSY
jgi:hypothetical protein